MPAALGLVLLLSIDGPSGFVPKGIAAPPICPSPAIASSLSGPREVVVANLPAVAASGTATGRIMRAIDPRPAAPETSAVIAVPAANAIDPAMAAAEGEAGATAPALSVKFDGLDDNDNPFALAPPDPQVAVGPDHVFEMVNIVGRVSDRTGGTIRTFSLASFFGVPSGYVDFDPKIIYDALSGRWFASYASFIDEDPGDNNDEGRLHLAASRTSDPTAAWIVYDRIYCQIFADYPAIGVTNDKFTVSSNVFDVDIDTAQLYAGVDTLVLEKADVMAGLPAASVGRASFPLTTNRYTVRPAQSLTSVNDQYLVTRGHVSSPFESSSNKLTVIRVTGSPDAGNVAEASVTDLTILPQGTPPDSETAGGGTIDSFNFRFLDASWRDGRLWTSGSAACIPPGDLVRSCAHLVEVDTSTTSVVQDIMFGAPGEYYSFPTVRTDASGDLYVSMTHTNAGIFAEARVTGRQFTDPLNTVSGSVLLRAGEVQHTSGQWGDYLGAAVDPNLPECVWLVGEYAKDTSSGGNDWGTFIGAASHSGGCDGDNDGAIDSVDSDDDDDGYTDINENGAPLCLGDLNEDSLDDGLVNDGCPTLFAPEAACADGLDDDADGLVNDGCPQDGLLSEGAFNLGTGAVDQCGIDGWPSELDNQPLSLNELDIFDITSFIAPRRLDKNPPNALYDSRWDLSPGPAPFTRWINIVDITTLLSGGAGSPAYPPMFGGLRAFGRVCPSPS